MGCGGKGCTWILFLLLLFLAVADLVFDWLFYKEANNSWSPRNIDSNLVGFIFAFAVIGSVIFLFLELWSIYKETFGSDDDDGSCTEWVEVLILVLEDIPQAILLILYSECCLESNGRFQVGKEITQLVTNIVKFVIFICVNARKKGCLKSGIILLSVVELALIIGALVTTAVKLT